MFVFCFESQGHESIPIDLVGNALVPFDMKALHARHARAVLEMVVVGTREADACLRIGVLAFWTVLNGWEFALAAFAVDELSPCRAAFVGLLALLHISNALIPLLMEANFAGDAFAVFEMVIVGTRKANACAWVPVLTRRTLFSLLFLRGGHELLQHRRICD